MKINEDGISRWKKRHLILCTRFQHRDQPEHQCTVSQPPKNHFSLLTAVSCCSLGSYTEPRQGPAGTADRQSVFSFFSPHASHSYRPHFWGPWIPSCSEEDCHLGDFTGTGFSLQSFTVAFSSAAPRTVALDKPGFISIYKERKRQKRPLNTKENLFESIAQFFVALGHIILSGSLPGL